LKIAEHLSVAAVLSGTVGVFGRNRSLDRRIHMIANYTNPTAFWKVVSILMLLVVGAFGLTDALAKPSGKSGANQVSNESKGNNAKTIVIAGVCRDEKGTPLSSVKIVLYRENYVELKAELLRTEQTGDDGQFHLRDLTPLPIEKAETTWGYALVVTMPGRCSIVQSLSAESLSSPLQLKLGPAAALQGRVTEITGKPVAGARVWSRSLWTGPAEGVCSTWTDADGRFVIADMTAWGTDAFRPQPNGERGTKVMKVMTGCYFDVVHPDFGHGRPLYQSIPATVDVVLQPAGIITGKVVDQVTGKPAAGVLVSTQGTQEVEGGGWQQTRTDSNGDYRLPSLLKGKYNLWAHAADRACAAIDSFAVEVGKTHEAPDLVLIEGGWIEGQLVDAKTGQPVGKQVNEPRLAVGLYGPSRPKSGAACQSCPVDDQGRFRLHVAPGINFPYIMTPDIWERTQRQEYFTKGIEVKSGEVVSVIFRILEEKPIPSPDPTPVRLPVPVPEERQAAALVRQLGGWYDVDKDNHVVDVNMVYHQTADGRRFDNLQNETDEALRTVTAFPRLKRLFLCKGQASDEGLLNLAKLANLEVLWMWSAGRITDAGLANFDGLATLKEVHVSNGQLGDASLAVFGRMPRLKQLSLQGNSFSDQGLKQLGGLKELRGLWVGMSRQPITDAGARHLAGLTELEHLDLQRAQLSDDGVAALNNLKNLRSLDLNGPKITDASLEHLMHMTKLQRLGMSNTDLTLRGVERLLTLPNLKFLAVPSKAIPPESRDDVQQRRPGLTVVFTVP
jgi:5-hydroxyisourate hydrolase-like protein (transthyretin family)